MKNLITMKRIFFFLVIPMVISNIVPSYSLAITQKKTKWNTNGSAFVNDGYDVVSYFKNNKALKGDKKFTVEWEEHMWLFATKQHADLFMNNPEKYAPQFGSYCSWAVSHGYSASVSPEDSWEIVDNKLYLNFSPSVHRSWQADNPAAIKRGHENWPSVKEDLGWGLSGNFEQSAKFLTEIEAVEKARNWLEGILFKKKE